MAHEIAHQWWGHGVTWDSYHDQWLSEGLAQFASVLFLLKDYLGQDVFFRALKEFYTQKRKRLLIEKNIQDFSFSTLEKPKNIVVNPDDAVPGIFR